MGVGFCILYCGISFVASTSGLVRVCRWLGGETLFAVFLIDGR